jgi:hypothetical protein
VVSQEVMPEAARSIQTLHPSSLLPRLLDALLAGIERTFAAFGFVGHFFARFGVGCHLGLVRRINLVIFFLLFLGCLISLVLVWRFWRGR